MSNRRPGLSRGASFTSAPLTRSRRPPVRTPDFGPAVVDSPSVLPSALGRDTEMEQLRRALQRADQGHGKVVAVVGEPGVGKSRLFYEFIHSHRTHGWLVLESGSVSHGKARSYLAVIDLLRVYFKIHSDDDHRQMREKVNGKLLTLDRALEPMLHPLLALLDVPVDDAQWAALDPPQRRRRTFDAVRRILLQESRAQPLLLVFEALHWADTETQALLDRLIESLPAARLLLLVNYRREYEHSWGSKTFYSQVRLDALPPDSAAELLDALLGPGAELEPLKRVLITRTDGNPFFLEESVRTLVETKVLLGDPGAYRLAYAPTTIQVPTTVQAVLAARIDRLPPDEKRLLQCAAVIGTEVPFALLEALAEVPEEALRRQLTHLRAAEFLYETTLFPDLEYTFKHALTHEVAYDTLLHERRRVLHARIVEVIERLYPDSLTEHFERLGHHAFRGQLWEQAVRYGRQAGVKAYERSANREAATWLEQALSALGHLPEGRDTTERAIDLRFDLRRVLVPLGDFDRLFHYLREAERLCAELGDQRRLGFVCVSLAYFFRSMGDYDHALEAAQRAAPSGRLLERSAFRLSRI